jgi:alpha-beta hydrolase superfamily lysophospholipase
MPRSVRIPLIALAGAAVVLAAAIVFGGPRELAPLDVPDPFGAVDFSDVPKPAHVMARDGTPLAYRVYGAGSSAAKGSVVLIHGVTSRGELLHPLAKGLARAGYVAYALDIRGHGESGPNGKIGYIGQLEDDLEDFVEKVRPTGRRTLLGFSGGGGFALRFAADARRTLFDNYLLLAPFLSQQASTYRPAGGGRASVGMPRIVALAALNLLGITSLNDLTVFEFAVRSPSRERLTPQYSYALARNFSPHLNYKSDIALASQPMEVLVGETDEQFDPKQFPAEFEAAGKKVPVSIVPGVRSHIELTLAPVAIQEAVAAVGRLDQRSDPSIERTSSSRLRWLMAGAHVER